MINQNKPKRPTEPMPKSFKPFWILLAVLGLITVIIAIIAYSINLLFPEYIPY